MLLILLLTGNTPPALGLLRPHVALIPAFPGPAGPTDSPLVRPSPPLLPGYFLRDDPLVAHPQARPDPALPHPLHWLSLVQHLLHGHPRNRCQAVHISNDNAGRPFDEYRSIFNRQLQKDK